MYVHGAMLSKGAEPFKQIVNTLSTESPIWNVVKIAQAVSEKKTFKKRESCVDFRSTQS